MAEMIDNAVKTAIAAVSEPEPVQEDMFHVVETGNLEATNPYSKAFLSPVKRGKGRPAGSVNKRTLATAEFFLGQYQHPLKVMFDIIALSVNDFARLLGLDPDDPEQLTPTRRLELFDRQHAIRMLVLKHVAAPMPTSAEAPSGHNGVAIAIDFGSKGVLAHSHAGDGGALEGGGGVEIEGIFKALSDAAQSEIK
jgi:hypothetical protein